VTSTRPAPLSPELSTRLTTRVGLRYPIINAPMAGARLELRTPRSLGIDGDSRTLPSWRPIESRECADDGLQRGLGTILPRCRGRAL
jgi:hypothetical protein